MAALRQAFQPLLRHPGTAVLAFGRQFSGVQPAATSPLPLAGLRVLELASVLAGPSVAQFFGELGADVVKVENKKTRGDVTRGWRLPGEEVSSAAISAYFSSCNLGKRSIALDAKAPRGREICRQLAAASDIVIASYKPGDAEKLGLDAQSLCAEQPRLIYAQITGYGLDSPRVGYDALIQAESGYTFMNGEPGPDNSPTKMPVALVDVLCAHQLKEAILVALLQRERTGKGGHLHVSLYASAVSALVNQGTGYLRAGRIPQRIGSEHPSIVPYGTIFKDRDGQPLLLAVGADSQFRSLCAILGRPELGTDPKFATNVARCANRVELVSLIAQLIQEQERDELVSKLGEQHVPAGVIADMSAVWKTPQAEALVVRDQSADAGAEAGEALGVRQVAWLGDGVAAVSPSGCPGYAEHTAEVLAELGFSEKEVNELVEAGVADLAPQ